MEENKKSAFLSKVEEFAKEMQETVSAKDAKRSIIILATESVENEDAMKQIIGVAGNGQELTRSIAKFANQEDTRPLLKRGLELSMIEAMADKIMGGENLTTINLTIK